MLKKSEDLTYLLLEARGTQSFAHRWSQCTSKASSESTGFAYAVGAEYIKVEFDEETKNLADAMVSDLKVAFKELLDINTWMDATTKVTDTDS